jgi:hypothetical protein
LEYASTYRLMLGMKPEKESLVASPSMYSIESMHSASAKARTEASTTSDDKRNFMAAAMSYFDKQETRPVAKDSSVHKIM